eukprot:SAG31_NODE_3317_length_4424_cov_3.662197_3_plen_78_part_00
MLVLAVGEGGTLGLADKTDGELKPCYEQGALMRQYDFIGTLVSSMEALGWGPYQADHEDGNGQFEVRSSRWAICSVE